MESQEYIKQEISSFLDRFQPKTEADIARLQDIQASFAAGHSLEDQYHNFIAIGDADLLRAFYKSVPDMREQILANPHCPEGFSAEQPQFTGTEAPAPDPIPSKDKHSLLSLDREIDLDLKGLADYEASLSAGEISGQERAGCIRRIENLQRLFDRVPSVLHDTDLTNNENPLFYDLLLAKQRISSNLKIFTRLRIGLSNRFAKSELDKTEDPVRSLPDELQEEDEPKKEGPEPEQEGPSEDDQEAEALATFLAEEEARAAQEAKAAEKKAANEKRQQNLRKQAKEQEEHSIQEQRQQEEAARNANQYPDGQPAGYDTPPYSAPDTGGYSVPPYEYTVPPQSHDVPTCGYDEQAEVLRRQEQGRKESAMQEKERQLQEYRAAQDEHLQKFQERMDRSYGYESFGNSHIDFSGKDNHGTSDVYPNVPDNHATTPAPPSPEPTPPASPSGTQWDQPFYQDAPNVQERTFGQPNEPLTQPIQPEDRPIVPSYSEPADRSSGPFYDPAQNPPVSQSSYDELTEWNRKHQQYKDDVLTQEGETRTREVQGRRDSAIENYQSKMDQSYGYQSFGHGHIDFSGKDNHGGEPFQPYVYTAGGGVASQFGSQSSQQFAQMSNAEIYRVASESGKITPEMSRIMRDNMAEMRKEYESAKGTPAFQEVSQRYNEARAAVMAVTNDIRNNQIIMENGSTPVTNTANVSRTYHTGRNDSFTSYQYTPTGVQGTSYENGKASGGVIVHNAPGTAGKEVFSRENPMLVTKAYEESLSRDAKLAKAQLQERLDTQNHSNSAAKLTAAELAAYRTSLDAYEGFRRAKADGLVKVTSASGAINTPDQLAWAARQETYRQTVEKRQWQQNRTNSGSPQPGPNGPSPRDNSGGRRSNDHENWNNNYDYRNDRNRNNNNDRRNRNNNNNNDRRDNRDRNNNYDRNQNNGNNGGGGSGTPRPDPRRNRDRNGWNPHIKVAPFGSVFSINYNRGKYTVGEKGSSARLLNQDTKLQRTGAMRNMGSRLYRNYSTYVPEASTMAGRKLYTMLQASNEAGSQSIRTFEQGRYYSFAGAGVVIAHATRNVGDVKRFERHASKVEMHNYGFKRELSNKEVARKLHTHVNDGRAAKKEIRQMYERESGLSVQERRLLSEKVKDHKAMGKETAKWAGLHNARLKEKVQKEVLEELHRNRNGHGLVTDNALKDLQAQRQQIQIQRRDILKSQTERTALNKRISELQRKGKGALSEAEVSELRELRGKLGKLSSDPRLKALDRKEQEILKLYQKKPDETSVGFKHIRLKDAQELRNKILREHSLLERDKFKEFSAIKTSVIKNNKQLLERQSEAAKIKVKSLLAKGKRTAVEEQELRQLLKLLKSNQDQIKAHANILNLRNVRDMKIEAVDKVRRTLLKNKQRKRIAKLALVSFMMKPLQEGDNIGAQGLAKGISVGTNPYVRGLVRSSVRSTVRFTKFAATKVGKVTGLDKTLAPAIKKTKEVYTGARKIVNTPKELKKKAIKTAVNATKRTANRLTPQFIKTGNAMFRNKMANLAARLQKSKLGKAYEAIARNFSKMKAALGTAAKAVAAVVGKVVLGLLALILLAGLITVIGGAIGGAIPSFLVMGDETTDDGKIDLTPYAEVFNEELLKFKEDVIAAKTAKDYENITEICYGPTDYNNIKEIISMMAVRMSQDLDMEENPDIEKYIRSIFNDSHIITTQESEPYSCSGCKTRTVEVGHSSSCPEGCTTKHTTTESYCPGDHVDLTITITTLVFDEIFTADTMGNEDQKVVAGGLIGDDFEITFYLPTGNQTATGTDPKADRTIAVDPDVIPLGTHVIINGKEYIAEDTGSAINGHIIDIFVEDESDIPSEGRLKNVSVYYADYEGEGMLTSEEWNGWVEENRIWAKTICSAPWDDLYYGLDSVGAYIDGTWTDYDWSTFEYSDESNLTQAQQRVAHIAKNSGSFGIAANAGYCQQWVRLVYSAAGFTGGNAVSANDAGDQWLVSKDWSNIPVGAAVYGYSSSVYGHVGIYVGDGKVYHNVGGVAVDSLEEWVSKYKGYGWGWQGGHDLTAATSGG